MISNKLPNTHEVADREQKIAGFFESAIEASVFLIAFYKSSPHSWVDLQIRQASKNHNLLINNQT